MRSGVAALGVAAIAHIACAHRPPPAFQIEAPDGVLAVGDIHGDLDSFRTVLMRAGLVDRGGGWVGGHDVLVQTGDFLDRGPNARALMDYLMGLDAEARQAGGRVIVLLGNHEAMNVTRDFREVSAATLAAFVDDQSEARRQAALVRYRDLLPGLDDAAVQVWLDRHPPGAVEYAEAVSPRGVYGRWLRSLPFVVRVDDSLFLHAGFAQWRDGETLADWNQAVHQAIEHFDDLVDKLTDRGVLLPHFTLDEIDAVVTASREALAQKQRLSAEQKVTLRLLDQMEAELQSSLLVAADGPQWFRGYARWPEERLRAPVQATMAGTGTRRIVSAHSARKDGRIGVRLDGALWLIDTGMWANGPARLQASLWSLRDGVVTGIYEDGRVEQLSDIGADSVCEPAVRSPRVWLGRDGRRLPFRTDPEVMAFLEQARVVSKKVLGSGTTRPERLLLEMDGIRARAIFRHIRARKTPGMRPDHEERRFRDHYMGEVAAYRLATTLGIHRIPPAVKRTIDGRRGSVQMWLEDVMTEGHRQENSIAPPDRDHWWRQFRDMRVFDALIDNTDRNQGNILIDKNWTVWMVDHTRTFSRNTRLSRIEKLTHCSRRLFAALENLDRAKLVALLDPYLSQAEIDAVWTRRDRLLELYTDRIQRLGEEQVLFEWPQPSEPSGPPPIEVDG